MPDCDGDGMLVEFLSRDSFGNWDTREYECEGCAKCKPTRYRVGCAGMFVLGAGQPGGSAVPGHDPERKTRMDTTAPTPEPTPNNLALAPIVEILDLKVGTAQAPTGEAVKVLVLVTQMQIPFAGDVANALSDALRTSGIVMPGAAGPL